MESILRSDIGNVELWRFDEIGCSFFGS